MVKHIIHPDIFHPHTILLLGHHNKVLTHWLLNETCWLLINLCFSNSWILTETSYFPLLSATDPPLNSSCFLCNTPLTYLQISLSVATLRKLRPSKMTLSTCLFSFIDPCSPFPWCLLPCQGHPFLSSKTLFFLFYPFSYLIIFFSPVVFSLSYKQDKKCSHSLTSLHSQLTLP